MQSTSKKMTDNKRRRGRWLILLAGITLLGSISATSAIIGAYYFVAPGLPPADTIRQIPLQIPLRIFSRDGRLIEEVGERRRILVTYDDLPEHVVAALVRPKGMLPGRALELDIGLDILGVVGRERGTEEVLADDLGRAEHAERNDDDQGQDADGIPAGYPA